MSKLTEKEKISRRMDFLALRERGWSDDQLAEYFGVAKKDLKGIESYEAPKPETPEVAPDAQ